VIATFKNMPDTSQFGPSIVRTSTDGPGPALVMAWTGTDGTGNLNSSYSNTGGTIWKKSVIPHETSVAGPALAERSGELFIAWAGTNPAHNLNVMSSNDKGLSWGPPEGPMQPLPGAKRAWKHTLSDESSDLPPALLRYGQLLVLAWTAQDSTVHLAHSQDNGGSWSKVTLPEHSIAGPALAAYTSGAGFRNLFLAFTGIDHRLYLRWIEGFAFDTFAVPDVQRHVLEDTSTNGPSLAVLNAGQGKDIFLAMAYSGNDPGRNIYVTYSLQGFSPFGNGQKADDSSLGTPAMFTYADFPAQSDEVVFAWAGTDGAGHLNLCPGPKLF
jgi:hypothetical protein